MEWLDSTLGLRLILLSCGVLLIGVLVWLDRRRRQASSDSALAAERRMGNADRGSAAAPPLRTDLPLSTSRDGSAHRPLPVIDWTALERDGGASDDEPRLAVHSMAGESQPPVAHQAATPVSEAATSLHEAGAPSDESAATRAGAFGGAPGIDHWPPEAERRICSLRVAPPASERFPGRVLRQGLLGTGFVHGELGIFHFGDDQGRALVSAANLARPGQLDPANMDFQRFGGLHLFTVLPGPQPDRQLLEQLFATAAELARRVGGTVQDGSGVPLTAEHRQELLRQFAGATPPAAGHVPEPPPT